MYLNVNIKSRSAVLIFIAIIMNFSCDKKNVEPKKGKVEFTFSNREVNSGGRKMQNVHAVLISVRNADGNFIYEKEKLELFSFGADYISQPIGLSTGEFTLTEFIVLDENDNAVYATPIEGSALDYLVEDPLPIEFSVTKDETTKVAPQVIKVDGHMATDFGYITFSFDVVETFDFSAGVLAYAEASQNFELTTSHLTVTSGTEVLFDRDLTAVTHIVTLKDGYPGYKLMVTKPGYNTYEKNFTADQLKAYSSESSLVITLLTAGLSQGLLAHYPFNGNAEDQTANNYDGITHGASLTTDRKGSANAAFSFDGIDDYISVPHNNAFNLAGNFTISLWAKVAQVQEPHEGINDILRKWNGNAEGYPFSISYLNPEADDAFEDKFLFVRYDGQLCDNAPTSFSPTITNDVFHHIVLVKNGSTLKQYLNNVLIEEFTDNTSCSIANTADMTIGCRGNLVRFFKGKIDDIRIYTRAVSSAEVANLYAE